MNANQANAGVQTMCRVLGVSASGYYEAAYRERVVKQLHRRAADFGFRLETIEGVS